MRGSFLRVVVLGLFVVSPVPADATILLFDQERDAVSQSIVGPTSSGGALPADYGDNVTVGAMPVRGGLFTYGEAGEGFTPNVSLDIFSATATETNPRVKLWQSGYGDLVNVIFADGPGTAGAPMLSVRLTAEPGYSAELYGFDLAGFGSDYTIAGVSVVAGQTTLYSEANVLVEGDASGPLHTTIEFAEPLSAPELLLQIDVSNLPSGIQDNVGLDNLRFGQDPPIPEPASWTLMAVAAVCWLVRRRRRGL
jgi:hypothetical protein